MAGNNPISAELVRHHLVQMGYDVDVLPEDVLVDFVKELTEMYQQGMFDKNQDIPENNSLPTSSPVGSVYSSASYDFKSNKEPELQAISGVGGQQIYKRNRPKFERKPKFENDFEFDDSFVRNSWVEDTRDEELIETLKELNLDPFKSKVRDQKEELSVYNDSELDGNSYSSIQTNTTMKSRPRSGCIQFLT
jgi:hypothetical protein